MKYVYEFIGTFFLVLTVGLTVLAPHDAALFAPLAIGTVLAVMVFAGGHISGGHYNPAVTLAVFLRGKVQVKTLISYWAVQLLAGVLAALLIFYLRDVPESSLSFNVWPALIGEFLFTFALCFVVLNVATSAKTMGNSYFGWAIGLIVFVGAIAVGSISGAAFNPAVALGITILKMNTWSNLWVYLVGNLAGAFAAAYVFKLAHPKEA